MERHSKPGGPGVRDRDEAETTKPNESTTTHQLEIRFSPRRV